MRDSGSMRFPLSVKAILPRLPQALVLFSAMILMGCDAISTKGVASSCETGTAQFLVYDGAMKRVCGCTEGEAVFTSSNSFTCTVPVNTTVYFYFTGISISHQISVSTIGTTQMVDASSTVKTAALVMNRTGTFALTDITTGIGGSMVVTP